MTMPQTDAPKMQSPKKGSKKPKLLILGCVLVFCGLATILLVGLVVAFFSNKDIPVFSDAVETAENLAVSDKKQAEMVQDDMKDTVFSLLPASGEDGLTGSYVSATYTRSELDSMITDKKDYDSVRYDMSMSVDMGEQGSFEVKAKGASKTENKATNMAATINGKYNTVGATLEGSGEVKTIGDTTYLKLNSFPALGLLDLSQLQGIWLESDATTTQGLAGGFVPATTPTNGGQEMTKSDLQKLEEIIKSDEVGKNITRLDDEVIEGVRTQCFRLDMDKTDLKNLIIKANNVFDGEDLDVASLEKDLDSVEYLKLDMCSGRRDGHLYRLALDAKVNDTTEKMTLKMNLKMWDYDKVDDKFEKPADTKKLQDVLTQMMSATQQ